MSFLSALVILLLAPSYLCTGTYDNRPGGDLLEECESGYGMFQVLSSYTTTGGGTGDRLWNWECRKIDLWHRVYCEWTDDFNTLEESFFFPCPADAFIAGVRSVYDDSTFDRLWSIKCCRILSVCLRHCEYTDKLAALEGPIDHEADEEKGVFNGFYGGPYDSMSMDRQYRIGQCKFEPCRPYAKSYFSKIHKKF